MKTHESTHSLSPLYRLILGAVCISFAPVLVKLIGLEKMGPTAIAFWRTALGAVMLFSWSAIQGAPLLLPRRVFLWSLAAGIFFFLDLFCWHRSIIFAGAGMATILANTQVFGTAVLSSLVFHERLTKIFFVAAISAIGGVALLIGVGSNIQFDSRYITGITFGLATGVVYANYLISLKKAGHAVPNLNILTLMAWTSLFSTFFLGGTMVIEGVAIMPPDGMTFGLLVALALVAQSLGWWLIASSLSHLDASRSGLVLLVQPVLATTWGILFFAERLTLIQICGAVITLIAIYIGSLAGVRSRISRSWSTDDDHRN
jgi:drug/metabolite transporter (DMT)-like permease